MKLLGQTLAILLAALLVAGATYALGNAGLIGSTSGGTHRGASISDGGPPAGFQAGAARGPGGDHDGGGASAALEIGKNLAIMAVIVALVAGGTALARRLWPLRA